MVGHCSYVLIFLAVCRPPPVDIESDENKNLRWYARLLRAFLSSLHGGPLHTDTF